MPSLFCSLPSRTDLQLPSAGTNLRHRMPPSLSPFSLPNSKFREAQTKKRTGMRSAEVCIAPSPWWNDDCRKDGPYGRRQNPSFRNVIGCLSHYRHFGISLVRWILTANSNRQVFRMGDIMNQTLANTIIAAGLGAISPLPAIGDSSTPFPEFAISAITAGSIVGKAEDGRVCRYLSDDGKIHCVYGSGPMEEFIAGQIIAPDLPRLGSSTQGTFAVPKGSVTAFLNGEHESRRSGATASTICRLAVWFEADSGQRLWIWHDELRQKNGGHYAHIDSDGDGAADLAISGKWSGGINGSRRWEPDDPNDATYSEELRRYPKRPAFGDSKWPKAQL